MIRNRQGFTLVELLIVLVLASVVMGVLYQTVATQGRAYRQSDARISAQQLTRAISEVLAFEFRELSASAPLDQGDSDIADMGSNWINIRALRKLGITCTGAPGGNMVVYELGEPFMRADSLLIFAENEIAMGSDDAWLRARALNVSSGGSGCPDAWNGYPIATLNVSSSVPDGIVRAGAPVRAFEWLHYEVIQHNGQWVFARRRGNVVDPLIGPLLDEHGVAFRYLDANGAGTTVPAEVTRIELTVRGASNMGIDGIVGDSIITQVMLRNNRRS
jgi:prepilin-type N-terminal cleavage/methylation domain-containing protein